MKKILFLILLAFLGINAYSQQDLTVKSLQIGTTAPARVNGIKTVIGADSLSNTKLVTAKGIRDWVNATKQSIIDYINVVDTIFTDPSLEFVSGKLRVTRNIIQVHATGSTVSVGNDMTWLVVNPASPIAALEIQFPPAPIDGQTFKVSFGGLITVGPVVTSLTLNGLSNTFVAPSLPTNATAGESLTFIYRSANSKWYYGEIGGTVVEVYNDPVRKARDLGSPIKAENFSHEFINATGTNLSTTQIFLGAVDVPVSGTYTGVGYYIATQGVFTASDENRIGLYSYSAGTFTLVASSTNDAGGNLWKATATVFSQVAFTTPVTLTKGTYFIGLLYNSSAQTTAPAISGAAVAGNGNYMNPGGTVGLYAVKSALTTLPSTITAGSTGTTTSRAWLSLY